METKFSAEFIAALVEQAVKHGATSLTVGDVRFVFGDKTLTGEGAVAAPATTTPMASPVGTVDEPHEIDEEDGERAREQQLAELILTDPVRYEELMANGDVDGSMQGSGAA